MEREKVTASFSCLAHRPSPTPNPRLAHRLERGFGNARRALACVKLPATPKSSLHHGEKELVEFALNFRPFQKAEGPRNRLKR